MGRAINQYVKWTIAFASFIYIFMFLLVYIRLHSDRFSNNLRMRIAGLDEPQLRLKQVENTSRYTHSIEPEKAKPTNSDGYTNVSIQIVTSVNKTVKNNPSFENKLITRSLILSNHSYVEYLDIKQWIKAKKSICDGLIQIHRGIIPTFSRITINPAALRGLGETSELEQVLEQSEEKEFVDLNAAFFLINCDANEFKSNFVIDKAPQHYKTWISSFSFKEKNYKPNDRLYSNTYTIVLVRYEYANVYWNLIDLYDVYLTTVVNNVTLQQTNVIFMDAHPRGLLDKFWTNIFHSVIRPYDLHKNITYEKLSWLFPRAHSPILNQSRKSPPAWLNFRRDILLANRISDDHVRNCSIVNKSSRAKEVYSSGPRLKVLLIWRRDYIAHARNPSGLIMRKIKNEAQLERVLTQRYPTFAIRGAQLDALPIKEQLYLVSHSDVLIGMHGAAMAFSVFMPPEGAVIELYPTYYNGFNWHMEYIAKWTGHTYTSWKNRNASLDDNNKGYSTIPPQTVADLLHKSAQQLCPQFA